MSLSQILLIIDIIKAIKAVQEGKNPELPEEKRAEIVSDITESMDGTPAERERFAKEIQGGILEDAFSLIGGLLGIGK